MFRSAPCAAVPPPVATLRGAAFAAVAVAVLGWAGTPAPAWAQDWTPAAVFVQAGVGERNVDATAVGGSWPWRWQRPFAGGAFEGHTEAFAGVWRAGIAGRHRSVVQLGLVPMLRWRPVAGRSPWFVEAGIGLSVTDDLFATRSSAFSTRWNFSDNLAVGRNFGARGEHALSLRVQHTSNAGIKRPNPGQDLVLVRYARAF